MRNAYSFGMKNQSVALMYSCLLVQLGRSQEAQVILSSLGQQGYETTKVYLLLSMGADKDEDTVLS